MCQECHPESFNKPVGLFITRSLTFEVIVDARIGPVPATSSSALSAETLPARDVQFLSLLTRASANLGWPRSCPWHQIIFVTGTDTAFGKTAPDRVAAAHLRRQGGTRSPLNPLLRGTSKTPNPVSECAGRRDSAGHGQSLSFPEPLAPLLAARRQRRVFGSIRC